jgi:hypothetical protein
MQLQHNPSAPSTAPSVGPNLKLWYLVSKQRPAFPNSNPRTAYSAPSRHRRIPRGSNLQPLCVMNLNRMDFVAIWTSVLMRIAQINVGRNTRHGRPVFLMTLDVLFFVVGRRG